MTPSSDGKPPSKPGWSHPTALIEERVVLGDDTKVWDGCHIRHGAKLGRSCIVGEKTYIAYDVVIGNYVKINACVYICADVTIDDFCMISAHTVFTNDRYPRSGNLELTGLETSAPTELTLATKLERGVTIGANATIGPGITLGAFSMVGMGSVVTRDVAPHTLVIGSPAKPVAWLCVCGEPLLKFGKSGPPSGPAQSRSCHRCHRDYSLGPQGVQLKGGGPGKSPAK
jgi:UDP-2-acetamido-3-amino-2,3-dideoxy-glucuronate N-acetyltransferase